MKLKWYGHASFRLTAADGTSVITDPYTPETAGFNPITETSDIVMISSDNDSFHCRADLIPGTPLVINALELARSGQPRTEKGVVFTAIEAMEAEKHPSGHPDQNGMYRIEMDGLHIGHMGDMGNPLNAKQIEFFKGVDVLLALTGGFPTIELDDLKTVIDEVKPPYVVPMHYRTADAKLDNILWLESFLKYFHEDEVEYADGSEIELSKAELPVQMRVLVLDYVR